MFHWHHLTKRNSKEHILAKNKVIRDTGFPKLAEMMWKEYNKYTSKYLFKNLIMSWEESIPTELSNPANKSAQPAGDDKSVQILMLFEKGKNTD